VPVDQLVLLALEIDGDGHEQDSEIAATVTGPHWVRRDGAPGGEAARLLDALAGIELPPGPGHAYIGGEHAVVSALRDVLVERSMPEDAINAKSYWRLGRQNAANGEPERA
jgi:NADPH-dependent ferric siderophore reductase